LKKGKKVLRGPRLNGDREREKRLPPEKGNSMKRKRAALEEAEGDFSRAGGRLQRASG